MKGMLFLHVITFIIFLLLGNSLVLWVLVKHRKQTNLTDIGLFNLALSDLLFVLMLPFKAHYTLSNNWTFGGFMCRFTSFSLRTGFFSSIFFMVFMTLDRYMVIMHSLTMARYRTMKAGVVVTVGVWLLSFSVSLPSFIFSKVSNESYGYGCYYSSDDIWNCYNLFSMNVVGLILPLFIMIACYGRIIPKLVNIKSTKRHRAIRVVISIVLVFFLFWAPYNIYLFLDYLNTEGYVDGDTCEVEGNLIVTATVTETFAYTHCCLNPIIYAFIGEKFMKRVLTLLRTCCPSPCFVLARDLPANSRRKSSIMSRSSEATSTFIT